ncbi:MAG: polysaccharide biosynthesis/export family protein [Coraliomargarita sp.]
MDAATGLAASGLDANPNQMSLLDDEWKLKVGDRVIYEVLEEQEDPGILIINAKGQLLVPLIGLVPAEGKTSRELAYEIKKELEVDFFYRATVLISQRQEDRNRGRVAILGEVNRPGEQIIPPDAPLSLTQALLLAGDFTLNADKSNVTVVRGGTGSEESVVVDVDGMRRSGDFSADVLMQAGDMVIVSRSDELERHVYVLGAVESPGLYPLVSEKATLSQMILVANGFTRFAKKNRVRLIKTDENGEQQETEVNVGKILDGGSRDNDPIVESGDMIIVDEKMISFSG